MLLASKSGDIAAATLVSQTEKAWVLMVEKTKIRLSKSDGRRRAFFKMSEALEWAGADVDMIEHFSSLEKEETNEPA